MITWRCLVVGVALSSASWRSLPAQARSLASLSPDTVTFRFVDADLRGVVQSMSRFLSKPVISSGIPGVRVTLETPTPVDREDVLGLLRGLVDAQHLVFEEDSAYYRITMPLPAPSGPPPGKEKSSPDSAGGLRLFVIRLKHARAADVAATVNLLFGGSGEFDGNRGLSTGTLSDELHRTGGIRDPPPDPSAPTPLPSHAAPRGSALSGPVTIVPDELTNALLVRASEEDYDVLTEAVAQLDIRPLQVLIEMLIVEARHDRSFSFGTSLFVPPQPRGSGTVSGSTATVGIGDVVVRFMGLGKADVDATLTASESRGDVRIISRPVLLASNNTEARLLVGSQRPFIQVSRSLPTDAPSRDQVVQYRDVGTRLTVRPTINQDGYVSLYVQQEINAATTEVAFDAPVISTREAVTQVLVRDGQTVVLGGLRDQQRDRSSSGIPILSSLPIIGPLFGTTGRQSTNTELYLFLTPRILRTDADADSVTQIRLPKEEGAER